jgi:hypothetical protein
MQFDKVKDYDGLVKDRHSGAILLANHAKANEYLAKKRSIQSEIEMRSEINTLNERLNDLETVKNDVSEIKALLQKLAK